MLEKCDSVTSLQAIPISSNGSSDAEEMKSPLAIRMENASFSWEGVTVPQKPTQTAGKKDKKTANDASGELLNGDVKEENATLCLKGLNLKIKKGELIGICGAVGSGKSALFNAITGHLCDEGGTMQVDGAVAYVGQVPFVLNATIRDNILFGLPMNSKHYYKAISASQLSKDLESMPENEMSMVGERGTTLSGGQKSRVALARAVHSNRDIYLLDDIFSSVDKGVAEQIFEEAVKGALANKTVLLATGDSNVYLARCDKVMHLSDGAVVGMDTHENLMNASQPYREFLSTGRERAGVPSACLAVTDGQLRTGLSRKAVDGAKGVAPLELGEEEEDFGLAAITNEVYLEYIRAAGGPLISTLVISAFVLNVFCGLFSIYWLSKWMKDVHKDHEASEYRRSLADDPDLSYHTMVYGLSLLFLFFTGLLKAMLFVKVSLNAASNLHNRMLRRVMHAATRFFDATPSGRVLNRFSKDMDEIDVKLPFSAEAFLQYAITCAGFLSVIVWVFPVFVLPCIPLAAVFVLFFLCFRAGIRALKRTENVSRSPLFSQVSSTLEGLTTIHSYGQTSRFVETLKSRLDDNSGAMFMFHAAMRWQAVWLDLLVVAVTFVVALLIVLLATSISPADAGMALAFALQMSGIFQFAVRSKTELEAKMTAVERVSHYSTQIEQERMVEDPADLDDAWPTTGSVEFDGVTLRYKADTAPALEDLNMKLADGQRVGIIGRTGSGKTSICNALFLLYPLEKGRIVVDSRDIAEISLSRVRRSMAIIPQDPVLLTGTLRFNIDPEGSHSDAEIWESLEKVGLNEVVGGLPNKLEFQISDSGGNLSSGQRQLVCMARTLLKGGVRIVVLDEATANVDFRTDVGLLKAVSATFAGRTVLLVTHRLNNVEDADLLVEMEHGRGKTIVRKRQGTVVESK